MERSDGKMRGNCLDYAAEQLWATPISSDGEKGGPNQRFGAGSQPLTGQATQWPTPTSLSFAGSHQPGNSQSMNETLRLAEALWQTPAPADVMGGRTSRSGDRKDEVFLNGQASECSRQAREISTDGEMSSKERRSLNPLFVEWLMAWPPFWTLIASTDFGCSATAFTRYRRLMQSALFALGSPPEPAPAQASLF